MGDHPLSEVQLEALDPVLLCEPVLVLGVEVAFLLRGLLVLLVLLVGGTAGRGRSLAVRVRRRRVAVAALARPLLAERRAGCGPKGGAGGGGRAPRERVAQHV